MKLPKIEHASGWLFCSPGKAVRSCRLLFTLSDGRCLRGGYLIQRDRQKTTLDDNTGPPDGRSGYPAS